jgi:hypothetical protein
MICFFRKNTNKEHSVTTQIVYEKECKKTKLIIPTLYIEVTTYIYKYIMIHIQITWMIIYCFIYLYIWEQIALDKQIATYSTAAGTCKG